MKLVGVTGQHDFKSVRRNVRPDVRGGKACFVGTRITVDDVLGYMASD